MFRLCSAFAVAMTGVGLAATSPFVIPLSSVQVRSVRLTSGAADSPLGGGTAFVTGPSGFPTPTQRYVDAADALYLQPHGFTGTAESLYIPQAGGLDTEVAQGQPILEAAIQQQIAAGHVDADNPVVVFGWSLSAITASLLMPKLAAAGVPSGDVHFVLVGDPNLPNGGELQLFDLPGNGDDGAHFTIPSLDMTYSGATPSDLYPTDIYTKEYDGVADLPQYSINLLADYNAVLGHVFEHVTYVSLTSDELTPTTEGGQAILLPGSAELTGEGLTNYYMIPAESLPLLDPLRLIPVIGQPLYDLLKPDMQILVNLGYGSITEGWNQGPANVPTTIGLFPTNLNPLDVVTALGKGLVHGVGDAIKDLQNPDTYRITPIVDNPVLSELITASYIMGGIDTLHPTLSQLLAGQTEASGEAPSSSPTTLLSLVTDLNAALSSAFSNLAGRADELAALFTSLPAYDATLFIDQLEAGHLLEAIGLPIAAEIGLVCQLASCFLPSL